MPKTLRNKYDEFLTKENLMKAHEQSQKGKRLRNNVIKFNLKKEEYIDWIYTQLKNRTYKHGTYKVFYVTEPKLRKIEASRYLDRVVHTWYVESFLKPYFLPQFIDTSYACLQNRGTHRAAFKIQEFMKICNKKWGEYYILKMDVRKYFQNINKEKLMSIIKKKIKDVDVLNLTKEIIYSKKDSTGIPIGNYTSQIFANIYLNELDQYIKHSLGVRHYVRFMDDAVILMEGKDKIKIVRKKIEDFLEKELKLTLNEKTNIFKNKQGVNFCGYQINEYRMKIRPRGKRKLKKKIAYLKYKIKTGQMSSLDARKYLAGHNGYMKYANVNNLINKLFYIIGKDDSPII
ncbi:MAG: reverse transcriptase/maturase family protein [Clostridia bacterium]|nr:reverse transcriptase/maturase family protein [Clostridia bacterium]